MSGKQQDRRQLEPWKIRMICSKLLSPIPGVSKTARHLGLSTNTIISIRAKMTALGYSKPMELVNSDMSTYELLDIICDFINSMSIIEHKNDVKVLCQMKMKLKEVTSKVRALQENYNEAMNQIIKTKEEIVSLHQKKGKYLFKTAY